ncbi:uncharacterized protein LOC110456457 isoform X2 [Mizuhopecten yessoensis]|uniref:B-cell differentiation antigen CD72 n=1 Tax=Mizuhopecten yessoensis TaxID=6573 RepID=A0A210QB00_MIZYE|nr:uncharacterized protein LOC110456457 isoform X2 [Mizuhopecten yessoensis]OWF45911.1 B-cell differentiation antigen CD72 [Mizuhopecten yessoensis]
MLVSITVFLVCLALGSAQSSVTCDDVNSMVCQDLYNLNPNMCENACYSVALCPRFCGKCPLKCYQCHEVASPDLCYTSTQCPSVDHFCITTQSFTDDFKEVYKLGCALNAVCASHFGAPIGRREDDNMSKRGQLQGFCCSTDLCNVKSRNVTTFDSGPINMQPNILQQKILVREPSAVVRDASDATNTSTSAYQSTQSNVPTTNPAPVANVSTTPPVVTAYHTSATTTPPVVTTVPVVTSNLCADVDAGICSRLATHFPDMCTVDCIANEVCPRKCGRCMGCYQCNHVLAPENCTHKTVCENGEQCYSVETISPSLGRGYRLGCLNEKMCSTFGEAAPAIFGKRQEFELSLHGGCCRGEYCNDHALLPTTFVPPTATTVPTTPVPPTTTTVPTTVVPTTAHNACPSRYSRCPSGWIHHKSSCFALSLTHLSWADAKAKCEQLCAGLADFSTSSSLHSSLQSVAPAAGNAGITTAWVDGRVSLHGDWEWSDGQEADHTLQQHVHNYDASKCGLVTIQSQWTSHGLSSSRYMDPTDCSAKHLPLCEIKHVYS